MVRPKSADRLRFWRSILLLVAGFGLLSVAWSQQSETSTAVTTLPAVEDELTTQAAQLYSPGQNAAGTAEMVQFQTRAEALDALRRAFVLQEYQRVLEISQAFEFRFNEEDVRLIDYYRAAAQQGIADLEEMKRGDRPYGRIFLGHPPKKLAETRLLRPSLPPLPGSADATSPPGANGDVAPVPTETIAVETPADGEATVIPIDQAGQRDRQVAALMTPVPATSGNELPPPAATAPARGIGNLQIYLTSAIVAIALLFLLMMVFYRRWAAREEDELLAAGEVSSLQVPAVDSVHVGGSRGLASIGPSSRTVVEDEFEESLHPETFEEFDQDSPRGAPVADPIETEEAPLEALADERQWGPTPRELALDDRIPTRDVPSPILDNEDEPIVLNLDEEPEAEALREVEEQQAEPETEIQDFIQIRDDQLQTSTWSNVDEDERDTLSLGPHRGHTPFAQSDSAFKDSVAPLLPDDLPTQRPGPDMAQTDVAEPPEPQKNATIPAQREPTRPASPAGSGTKPHEPAAADAFEITRTGFQIHDAEQTAELEPAALEHETDLPLSAEDEIKAFHADETVSLRPGQLGDETVDSALRQQDAPERTLADSTGGGANLGNELFEREYQQGLIDYDRGNWAGAVHHLSIAAALRPEDRRVKEKLREARRRRKDADE